VKLFLKQKETPCPSDDRKEPELSIILGQRNPNPLLVVLPLVFRLPVSERLERKLTADQISSQRPMSTLPVLLPVIVVLLVSISASARRCLISEQPSSLAANVNCYIEADNVTIAPLGNLAITLTWANLSNAFSFDAFLWNNGGDPDFYFSSKQTPNKTNYEERSRNLGIRDEQVRQT
jgi:hypothetical protein